MRAGEGYYNKPNLYYRCSDRVLSFPLPPKCEERGINARVADELVWKKIAGLMSSPKLLAAQINRWFRNRQTKAGSALVDAEALKKEVAKLKEQIKWYNKGYGAGVFTLEQLKDYTDPLREKIGQLERQITNASSESGQKRLEMPGETEMKAFAEKAKEKLQNLKFEIKRAIILNTVEKVIGTQSQLQVIGYIPLNVQFFTEGRYRRSS